MEYNFSLEQVLGAIMEGIKFNEERVVREGAVSDELIEVVIRNFLTINEIVEEMVEKVVIEVDNSTVLQDMQAPSSVFNNVTNEPIAGPSCRR